jgi:hypothetical protein
MFEVRCLHIPVTDRTPFEGKSTFSDVGFEEIVVLFKSFVVVCMTSSLN